MPDTPRSMHMRGRSSAIVSLCVSLCTVAWLASCSAASDSLTSPNTPPGAGVPALINASEKSVSIGGVGAQSTLTVSVYDASGRAITAPSVVWSSDNPAIAEVAGGGTSATVIARAAGTTRVKAVSGPAAIFFDIRVLGVRGITITPTAAGLRIGDALPLRATVDGDEGALQTVKWATLNPSIATVDASGIVTGIGVGTTSVRASASADPNVVATATIVVQPARTVQLAPGLSAITLWVGDTRTVPAQADVDSTQVRDLAWTSDNAAVATVDANGTITARSVGTTIIRVASVADPRAKAELLLTVLPARRVTVTPSTVSVGVQQPTRLTAVVTIENGQSTAVKWSSSDLTVAVVAADGTVTGVALGVASVTATAVADTLRKGSALVSVVPSVRSVTVSPATLTTFVGDNDQYEADVITDGPLPRTVTWRSSNPSIALVSASGVVTSMAVGTATLTAIATADTTRRGIAQVTVQPAPIVGILPSSATIAIGQSLALSGRVSVGPGLSTAALWRSSDAAIASVDGAGTVTGQSTGTATITLIAVADTTKRATALITVAPLVRSVAITPPTASGFAGDVIQLTATVTADGSLVRTVSWRTSNAAVAAVSSTGAVSLVAGGQATISAIATADTTKRATAQVTVSAPQIRSVTLTPTSAGLFIGQGAQLTATVVADGALSTLVQFRSSNPAVATVNSSGQVSAVAIGSATISALSAVDTTKRASAAISVTARPVTVSISPRPITLSANQSQQLAATVTADPGVSTAVNWTSSTAAVATVSSSGLVSALTTGSALITATSTANPTVRDTVTVIVAGSQLAASWAASRLGGALYEDVLAIVGFGTNAAFAVNVVGDIYRWDGTAWTLSTRGSQFGGQFLAVHGTSSSYVIAVGTNGIIARFDGSNWAAMTSGTTRALNSAWVEGAGAAFAVGANGTALRLAGSSWSATTTGSTQALNAVWSVGGVAFAAGGSGEMLRYNGTSWARLTVPTAETFYGVSGTSASNVVGVGTNGTIVRYNGTTWTLVSNSVASSDLYGVSGSTANNGRMYIASDAGLLQLDGSVLSLVNTPYRPGLYAVSADANGVVWTTGQRGSAMRSVSGAWTTTNMNPDLLDVWSTSPSNAWAVGEFGFVYRYNGTGWSRESTPTTVSLNAVWGASSTDAFAGGDGGTMLRYGSGAWSAMSFPSSATVNAIWGSSSTNVYAVTSSGQILRFNGTTWSVSSTVANPLWGIFGLPNGEVYVAGENGSLFRFNGSGWTSISPTGTGTLTGMWGSASGNLLTVGSDISGFNGVAYQFNGSSWTTQSLGTTRVLTSVWGPTSTDVYATGEQGTMLRFNGSSWQSMATGTSDLLWSLSGSPTGAGAAFAVGYNSTLLTGIAGGSYDGLTARALSYGSVRSSFDPSPAARAAAISAGSLPSGPLPSGKARRQRKSLAQASARADAAIHAPPASIKFRQRDLR